MHGGRIQLTGLLVSTIARCHVSTAGVGDWQLNPLVFSELDNAWGPHTVDRFASFHNSQVPLSTAGVGTPARRQSMPSLWTGQEKIIGGVPQLV